MSSEVRTNRPMALRAELVRKMSGGGKAELDGLSVPMPTLRFGPSDEQAGTRAMVEVVQVSGPLWSDWAKPLAGELRDAAVRTRRDLLVAINSPGGDVAGMADLVAAMRTARAAVESKGGRLVALVNDEACSAGYWLASQATEVWATRLAEVGCIGVYAVLYDESQAFAASGVQPVLVANDGAGLKGAGLPGLPISEDLVAQVRRSCNAATAQFVADVAAGRGKPVEAIAPLATGAVWTAAEARAMGLVDKVTAGGLAEAVAELSNDRAGQAVSRAGRAAANRSARRRSKTMADDSKQAITMEELEGMPGGPELIQSIKDSVAAEAAAKAAAEKAESEKPKAATVAELRAAFPGQPEFVLAALENGESLLAAKARMGDMAAMKLEAMAKQVAELQGKLAAAGGAGGTAPVRTAGSVKPEPTGQGGTAAERYTAGIARIMAEKGCTRLVAAFELSKADPELTREYHGWKKRNG